MLPIQPDPAQFELTIWTSIYIARLVGQMDSHIFVFPIDEGGMARLRVILIAIYWWYHLVVLGLNFCSTCMLLEYFRNGKSGFNKANNYVSPLTQITRSASAKIKLLYLIVSLFARWNVRGSPIIACPLDRWITFVEFGSVQKVPLNADSRRAAEIAECHGRSKVLAPDWHKCM